MSKRVLIPNRGEIAIRGIHACEELGYTPVVVYHPSEKDSLHVKLAHEAIEINTKEPEGAYLSPLRIINAARKSKCKTILPLIGFLSESSNFARLCWANGITFVGPKAKTLKAVADKTHAKKIADKVNIPIIPGTDKPITDAKKAYAIAEKIGCPQMIKSDGGGGGRGMRIVYDLGDFINLFNAAQQEARLYFNNDKMLLERYLPNCRHVEVQILGDNYGNIIVLGDRGCSMQYRHQKMIEEALAPGITQTLRKQLWGMAKRIGKHIGYRGAGTVEFFIDEEGKPYFGEVNGRLQIEHPVTEAITGVDILRTMLLIADGEKMPYAQKDIEYNGHSIECRINALDCSGTEFYPSSGTITEYIAPGGNGIRVDSHLYPGFTVTDDFDPMVSKLTVHDENREYAIARAISALRAYTIGGIDTNIDLLIKILESPQFRSGQYHTGTLEEIITPESQAEPAIELTVDQMYQDGVAHGCYEG